MAQHPRKTPRQATEPEVITPLSILLVENNPGDVRLTKERFAEARIPCTIHVVRTLDGTRSFLDERGDATESPVDAVLLDGRLTTEANDSLLRRLTTAHAEIPFFLTVQTETEADLLSGDGYGPLPFLTKPVDPNEVIDRICEGASGEAAVERSVE